MQEEIWKDIPGYEGLYQVSNLGNVKSLDRYISYKNTNKLQFKKGVFLKAAISKSGYKNVCICKYGKQKSIQNHQLVAMAFLNHIPNGVTIIVDHINNDKLDNNLNNLQVITNRENCSKDKKNKSSKYTGLSFYKREQKFFGSFYFNGKHHKTKGYKSEEIAFKQYNLLKNKIIKNERIN